MQSMHVACLSMLTSRHLRQLHCRVNVCVCVRGRGFSLNIVPSHVHNLCFLRYTNLQNVSFIFGPKSTTQPTLQLKQRRPKPPPATGTLQVSPLCGPHSAYPPSTHLCVLCLWILSFLFLEKWEQQRQLARNWVDLELELVVPQNRFAIRRHRLCQECTKKGSTRAIVHNFWWTKFLRVLITSVFSMSINFIVLNIHKNFKNTKDYIK